MFNLHILPFSLHTLSQGQKLILPLDASRATMNFAVRMSEETILEELLLSKKKHNWTWMINVVKLLCMYYHFSISHGTVWVNYGWTMAKSCRSACMYVAGQRVLCLLQNLFKQSKFSLMLTLARGKCWGSCSNYNWDPWVLHIALHASRNILRRLKRLETVQAIEHSVVVNACKYSGNSYYWSQVTTLLIRRSMNSPYILYGTPSKFYPSLRTWRHYASQPLASRMWLSVITAQGE